MGRARSFPRSRPPRHGRLLVDRTVLRRWLLVLALAVTTGALTRRVLADALAARHRWGDTAAVLVTTRAVPAGGPLAGAVRTEEWPASLRPPSAVTRVGRADRAAGPLEPGVPLTAGMRRGAPEDVDGRLVAITLGPDHLPVSPGDHVDVWATVDPSLGPGRLRTDLVVRDAVVARTADRTVVVRVAADDAGPLAEAVALATVTLVAHV